MYVLFPLKPFEWLTPFCAFSLEARETGDLFTIKYSPCSWHVCAMWSYAACVEGLAKAVSKQWTDGVVVPNIKCRVFVASWQPGWVKWTLVPCTATTLTSHLPYDNIPNSKALVNMLATSPYCAYLMAKVCQSIYTGRWRIMATACVLGRRRKDGRIDRNTCYLPLGSSLTVSNQKISIHPERLGSPNQVRKAASNAETSHAPDKDMMTSSNGNIFPGEFPAQRPVTRSFDVFFELRLNKRLSKQSWDWWFETLSRSLWRHCNGKQLSL